MHFNSVTAARGSLREWTQITQGEDDEDPQYRHVCGTEGVLQLSVPAVATSAAGGHAATLSGTTSRTVCCTKCNVCAPL